MNRKIFIVLFLGLSSIMLPLARASAAEPQPSPTPQAPQAEGLTISPPLYDIVLKPGETYNYTIKLNNPTKNLVEVYPVSRNFSAAAESGQAAVESPSEDPTTGLATWISFTTPKLALTPQQDILFNFKIIVPKDAEPGGHYASVLFASQPPKANPNATQVALASMIGTLILAKVPGDIHELLTVKKFTTDRTIYLKPPVNITLKITNSGNIHVKPLGDITITNWGKTYADIDFNPNKGNVLPNSTRSFENLTFNTNKWSFGKFTAKLVASYGETNQPLGAVLTFWIIPIWLIIALGILLLLIILIVIIIIYRRKKKKNIRSQVQPPSTMAPPSPPPPSRFVMR